MKKLILFLSICLITATISAQDSLLQYTGKYIFPDGSVVPDVDVTLAEGALFMSSVAGTSSLVLLGIDSFAITEFNGIALFKRNGDKKINAVYIDAMGYILEGKKQEDSSGAFSEFYFGKFIEKLHRKMMFYF